MRGGGPGTVVSLDCELHRAVEPFPRAESLPSPLLAELGLPLDERGHVKVDSALRVEDRPRLWALGDCASVPNEATPGLPDPPTSQHALRQGRLVGENVAARHMTVTALGLPREVEVLRSMPLSAGQPGRLHIESEQPIRAELLLDGDAAPQIVNIRSLDLAWDDGGKTGVTAARTSLRLEVTHPTPSPPAEKYGLCLFELNIDDLRRLPQLLEQVTPWILPDGKIMVLHINNTSVGAVAEIPPHTGVEFRAGQLRQHVG